MGCLFAPCCWEEKIGEGEILLRTKREDASDNENLIQVVMTVYKCLSNRISSPAMARAKVMKSG